VRDDVLTGAGIDPEGPMARSLKFAGLRGMIASYIMMVILITQKTDALPAIVVFAVLITAFQWAVHQGGLKKAEEVEIADFVHHDGSELPDQQKGAELHIRYPSGMERSYDEARQRGIVHVVNDLMHEGKLVKFNVESKRIRRLICYVYGINPDQWEMEADEHGRIPEPTLELEEIWQHAASQHQGVFTTIEYYSHVGIFSFIEKFHVNWVSENRSSETVQRAMIRALFIEDDPDEVWAQYERFSHEIYPEEIWQFSRERYMWAKDQWPNLSDRVTTIWTLQDLGLLKEKNTDKVLEAIGATM
jgi:hypothetical protein